MVLLKKKYENNPNVILCDSLQSIGYWFFTAFQEFDLRLFPKYDDPEVLKTGNFYVRLCQPLAFLVVSVLFLVDDWNIADALNTTIDGMEMMCLFFRGCQINQYVNSP